MLSRVPRSNVVTSPYFFFAYPPILGQANAHVPSMTCVSNVTKECSNVLKKCFFDMKTLPEFHVAISSSCTIYCTIVGTLLEIAISPYLTRQLDGQSESAPLS